MPSSTRVPRPGKTVTCSTPAQTFPYFSQLPPELRLKVWEYNLPEPRIVSVRCGAKSPSSSPPPAQRRASGKAKPPGYHAPCSLSPSSRQSPRPSSSSPGWCTSPAPIPTNLHVCHESRVEALRHYALMFGIARQPGHVFFDPARDVLYFGPRQGFMAAEAQLRTMLALADPDELARVQRVALSAAVLGDVFSPHSFSSPASTNLAVDVLHLLRAKLPHLQELIVVPHDENPVHARDATLVPLPLPAMSWPLGPVTAWPAVQPEEVASGVEAPTTAPSGLDISDPNAATTDGTNRLARQVHAAMRRVCAAVPDWTPPRWRTLVISCKPRPHRGELASDDGDEDPEDSEMDEDVEKRVLVTKGQNTQLGKHTTGPAMKTACCCNCRAACGRSSVPRSSARH